MAEVSQNYKKIQAILCILVFGCIVGALLVKSALLATGAILLACAICRDSPIRQRGPFSKPVSRR